MRVTAMQTRDEDRIDMEHPLKLLALFPYAFPSQAKKTQPTKQKKPHQASLQSCEVGIISPFG